MLYREIRTAYRLHEAHLQLNCLRAENPMTREFDVAVIGGGIVGAATSMALLQDYEPGASLVVLEAEPEVAQHQTGHNSGVIHSGLYYKPNSLKARLCVDGRRALYQFCQERQIPHECCGKVVVATRPNELPALEELERRGNANGLQGWVPTPNPKCPRLP